MDTISIATSESISITTAEETESGENNSVIRMIPKWKYSRDYIIKFIKKCNRTTYKWEGKEIRVFWIANKQMEFKNILSDTELAIGLTEQTQTIESSIYQMNRLAFSECYFFTPNDIKLFCARMDEIHSPNGLLIDWHMYNWWNTIHTGFVRNNNDCAQLKLTDKIPGEQFTLKELLFNYLIIKTDYFDI